MGKSVVETTKKNMKRNRLLSMSTIFVTSVVLIISSFFISIAIMGKKTVDYYEKKAQVIIFFKKDTKESNILLLKDKLYNPDLVESIEYISQEQALSIYKEDFAENPDLLSTVTADSLPPSLEIRAKSVDSLLKIIEIASEEKKTNATIDEVMYFKDVVQNLKRFSTIIQISTAVLIVALVLIAFSLIRVTIGFNINTHREEIKVMHLVGSSDEYIKLPFILEGCFYGLIGGFIAASVIIIPWYLFMSFGLRDNNFAYWLNQVLRDFGFSFLKPVNILFLLAYYATHLATGAVIGTISSISAVKKYLD